MIRAAMRSLPVAIAVLLLSFGMALAQDETTELPPAAVYVTTQDFSSLRQGPGTGFQRLTVVPPTQTLPAYGRTSDTQWIQVEYDGQRGWIASILLVWSGDIIDLPVDGVNPYPFVRRAAAIGITTRETPVYAFDILPGQELGTIPEGTEVELTGRLGEHGYFRFQVRWQGQLYWVGNWNIRIIDGDFRRLLDLAYIYPYGQLIQSFQGNLALSVGSYRQISNVWYRIARGDFVACAPIPPYVEQSLTLEDVIGEPLFYPGVEALSNAVTHINRTISAFEDACTNPAFSLTVDYVNAQIADVQSAEQNLILAGSFLEPLRTRNPLLDERESRWTGGY